MAGGEVCFELFSIASSQLVRPTKPDVPLSSIKECCIQIKALADLAGDDIYRNDVHSVINKYDKNFYGFVSIVVQKLEAGTWVDKQELFDDSLGKNYLFGAATNSEDTEKYLWVTIEWQKVLVAYGEGQYRFRFKEFDYDTNETESFYPFEFCLKGYTEQRANNSTVFNWNQSGFIGDYQIDTEIWDFTGVNEVLGSLFYNQLRLDGIFGFNKSEYEREYVRYSNGREVWLKNKQIETYTWHSGYLEAELHSFIKTNILQADTIYVTDYNKNNPNVIKDKVINANSEYEPRFTQQRLTSPVSVDFVQGIQNRVKKRC